MQIKVKSYVPSEQAQELGEWIKLMNSSKYSVPPKGLNICCFAGDDDDLVVAVSSVDNRSVLD